MSFVGGLSYGPLLNLHIEAKARAQNQRSTLFLQERQHPLTEQRAANFSVPLTHHCDVTK